jgi:hypothetical protein
MPEKEIRTGGAKRRENTMSKCVIQDWVESEVLLQQGETRHVKYRVYRESDRHYQEVCTTSDEHVHTLELPEGMRLDMSSYEVLLRYVLSDIAA